MNDGDIPINLRDLALDWFGLRLSEQNQIAQELALAEPGDGAARTSFDWALAIFIRARERGELWRLYQRLHTDIR